jgi:hypothetical protein
VSRWRSARILVPSEPSRWTRACRSRKIGGWLGSSFSQQIMILTQSSIGIGRSWLGLHCLDHGAHRCRFRGGIILLALKSSSNQHVVWVNQLGLQQPIKTQHYVDIQSFVKTRFTASLGKDLRAKTLILRRSTQVGSLTEGAGEALITIN